MDININTEIVKFVNGEVTQPELAEKAGVGIRFVRELEQGKQSV